MPPTHGLGDDPLDGLLSVPEDSPKAKKPNAKSQEKGGGRPKESTPPLRAGSTPASPPKSKPPAQRKKKARKQKQTYAIDADVAMAARNAADALQGPPTRLTLAAIVEEALRREVARLERQYNNGEAFPQAEGGLRRGRRVGSG